jgi:hypothetical protein
MNRNELLELIHIELSNQHPKFKLKINKLKNTIDTYFIENIVSIPPILNHIFTIQDNYIEIYNKPWNKMSINMKYSIAKDITTAIISREFTQIPEDLIVNKNILLSSSFTTRVLLINKLHELLKNGSFEFKDRIFYNCLCSIYATHILDYDPKFCDGVYMYNINILRSIGYGHFPKLKTLGYSMVKDHTGNTYYQKHHLRNIPKFYLIFDVYG